MSTERDRRSETASSTEAVAARRARFNPPAPTVRVPPPAPPFHPLGSIRAPRIPEWPPFTLQEVQGAVGYPPDYYPAQGSAPSPLFTLTQLSGFRDSLLTAMNQLDGRRPPSRAEVEALLPPLPGTLPPLSRLRSTPTFDSRGYGPTPPDVKRLSDSWVGEVHNHVIGLWVKHRERWVASLPRDDPDDEVSAQVVPPTGG